MIKAEIKGREALTRRLNKIAPNVEKYATEAKLAIARDAAAAISRAAPREHGDYAASIEGALLADAPAKSVVGVNSTKDKTAAGVFASFIWRFLEFGTRGHVIAPKNAKRLRFEAADGTLVTTMKVNHPGTPAQAHVFPTWRAMKKKARSRLLRAVNKGVKEAMGK